MDNSRTIIRKNLSHQYLQDEHKILITGNIMKENQLEKKLT